MTKKLRVSEDLQVPFKPDNALNLEQLEKGLKEPIKPEGFSAEELTEAFEQARLLAENAYVKKSPEAEKQAERILYLLHTLNHFAPPLQAQPGLIYGVLGRAKLRKALFLEQKTEPASPAAMRKELEELVKGAEENDHPILNEICAFPDPSGILIYAKNWMITAHGFINQLAALFQRAPNKLRKVVRENMGDEFEGTEHAVLRDRFLQDIGVKYSPQEALRDPDYLFESMSVLNYRTLISSISNPYYAFGSFYSIEGVFYQVSRRLTQGLRKRGLPEETFEMFTLHSEVDHDHANEWMESLEAANLTDMERGWVVAGGRAQMRIRHRHYEAMKSLIKSK